MTDQLPPSGGDTSEPTRPPKVKRPQQVFTLLVEVGRKIGD
ncbi:MAG: hypothetical protein ACI9O0_001299, partial [Paracoccaceae bacterium]